MDFLILVLEKDEIAKQGTTSHKHVTVIAKVVLVVEVNLFSLSPYFLIEDEYMFYYINIVCGMCGMLLWCVMSKLFCSGGCDILLICCDVFKQNRISHKL